MGLYDYMAFCKSLDSVFDAGTDQAQVLAGGKSSSIMQNDEKTTCQDVLRSLWQIIASNRILLKPSFQDFDPANTQHITLQQFSWVLKQLWLMPNERQFELLCKNYFDKGNTREVNYVKFCHDVDNLEPLGL